MITHKGTETIDTQRLHLRKLSSEDAEQMYHNWAYDERVTRYLTWEPHASVEASRELLTNWSNLYDFPHYYNWGIEFEGQLIGNISVVRFNEDCEWCDLGYCIGYDWWSRGIVTEAVRAVIAFLFEEVGVHRIKIMHLKDNPASGRVAVKCGMLYEGTDREAFKLRDGKFMDQVNYSILRNEYFQKKIEQ